MLAKLGSAHKKPNQQTIIRNRAIQQFLSNYKFTKIRNLGGKLGDEIVALFNTDTVKDLLSIPIEQMKAKLGDDTGSWVHQIIRGIDTSEVNPRTQIKSMLSAKSFRPSINTPEQAIRWLRIFVADIYSRLVEEGVLENKRRPKTINLHHRHNGQTRSRQTPIPQGKAISEDLLFDLAKNLLGQIILEGRVWPCANISLSVGGFEDGVTGNMGIGAFLLTGDEAKAMKSTVREDTATAEPLRPEKRRRVDNMGIDRFLVKKSISEEHDEELDIREASDTTRESPQQTNLAPVRVLHQPSIDQFLCRRCHKTMESEEALRSHSDWHFAKDLQDEDRAQISLTPLARPTSIGNRRAAKKATNVGNRAGGSSEKKEKGQSKLAFGP
jgi:DNA polymerase eta